MNSLAPHIERHPGFVAGFVSAIMLLGVLSAMLQAASWLASHPFPEAVVAFLTAQRLSIVDVIGGVFFFVVIVAVYTVAVRGPRL